MNNSLKSLLLSFGENPCHWLLNLYSFILNCFCVHHSCLAFRAKSGAIALPGISGIHKYNNNRYRNIQKQILQSSPESDIQTVVVPKSWEQGVKHRSLGTRLQNKHRLLETRYNSTVSRKLCWLYRSIHRWEWGARVLPYQALLSKILLSAPFADSFP